MTAVRALASPWRALRLGARLSRCTGSATSSRPAIAEESRIFGGTPADIYRHRRKNFGVWVVAHGLTIRGGREPRLIVFARALAAEGLTCVVPTLPGLSACRWDVRDIDALGAVVRGSAQACGRPVGLLGFSFGGSYALLAAARPEHLHEIRGVFSFGAYHRLAQVLAGNLLAATGRTTSDADLDRALYARLTLVLGGHVAGSFTAVDIEEMRSLAARYCLAADVSEKRELNDRLFRTFPPDGREIPLPARELLDTLSPAGRLAGIACPVTLIHDARDHDIPPAHAAEIFAELPSTTAGEMGHRLCITPLLSHLSPALAVHPVHIARFVSALSRLFA